MEQGHKVRITLVGILWLVAQQPASGWDAHGHRTITQLAIDSLPADAPGWLRDEQVRDRIAYQSSEADRWRGSRSDSLNHINKPDHYLDVELLDEFGLTLETVPPLRNEYLRALIISKHLHPEKVSAYDAEKDRDRTKEWPGMALHAIAENYAKLQSSFVTLRTLEKLDDPGRAAQLVQARENVIFHMGMLSHFVGDLAQPLHTTKHFNGWVGDNPNSYTTSNRFHSYIDGGVLRDHQIDYDMVRKALGPAPQIDRKDPWKDVIEYFRRSNGKMEACYRMEKDGTLKSEPGREMIVERLADASTMLSAMYYAAYTSAAPTEKQMADFVYFDGLGGAGSPPTASAPASAPAQPAAPQAP